MAMSVFLKSADRNRSANRPRVGEAKPNARDFQILGSGTLRRIQTATRAGKMPMRKRALQPYTGRIAAEKSAARR